MLGVRESLACPKPQYCMQLRLGAFGRVLGPRCLHSAVQPKGSGHGTCSACAVSQLHPTRSAPVSATQVVVCTTAPLAEAKRLDALCHAAGIAFIWAETRGVFARVFTDFGPNFTVYDVDGELGRSLAGAGGRGLDNVGWHT